MKELKIQAPKWKMLLAVLALLVFVTLGVLMLIGDTSIFYKLVGVLAIVFFGGFGSVAMYSSLFKGKSNIILTPESVELNYPDCPSIPIKWDTIEAFGIHDISGQKFTTIKLKDYEDLIQSIPPSDVQKILRKFKYLKAVGHTTAVVGALNLKQTKDLSGVLPKSAELQNFAAYLAYSRRKFGGEFQIAWNMRDRKAVEFAAFLEEQRKAFTK